MRKMGFAALAALALVGCKKQSESPVDRILETGIEAETQLQEMAARKAETQDVAEVADLTKKEGEVRDAAVAAINGILGGKGARLPLSVAPCTDSLPIVCGNGSIGIPDFHKGEFRINVQIATTQKKPLPEGAFFQVAALDAQGKVLASKEGSVVDSLKIGDSLYAGAMFKGVDIKGMAAISAR